MTGPTRSDDWPFHLFEAYGIEIEYMIVDAETLDVRPWADRILRDPAGEVVNEIDHGSVSWCNELAAHVLELKCTRPAASLSGLDEAFAKGIREANRALAAHGARLLPGGMHPWMDPDTELVLWRQENREIYQAYDRIFGCRGHGWANLQSMQINLPFADDDEFGRLHAAIRAVLPLLGGISASTPIMDGGVTGLRCNRMEVYRLNSARVPLITGAVVPEPVFDIAGYRDDLLGSLYRAIAPMDPQGVLQEEWLNSRGAIARFDRGAIEIRTLDSQECAAADLAIAALTSATVEALVEERWSSGDQQRSLETAPLSALFLDSIRLAEDAILEHSPLAQALGLPRARLSLAQAWGRIADRLVADGRLDDRSARWIERILKQGTLATRLLRAVGDQPDRGTLRRVWGRLAEGLQDDRPFEA